MNELAVVNNEAVEEKKYIAFKIGNENFGIDIFSISSIINMPTITKMPGADDHFRGIIYLREEVIPILSLRRMMGLEDDVITHSSKIIITNVAEDKQIGIIVDEVLDVVTMSDEDIKEASVFLKGCKYLINGVGKMNDELISLVNTEYLA